MIIKSWGSRGSIPVCGKSYLKYGGDTTCIEIRTQSDDIIIIDAGTGIRRLGNQLIKKKRKKFHFIFTHAHWDHIMGFPFFKPLYYPNSELHMHRCPFHSKFVEKILSKVMAPPNFPVKYHDIKAKLHYADACPAEFHIGSVKVIPIPLSHPNGGSGYKFIENDKTFVFLTDNELGSIHPGGRAYEDYVEFSADADLLIHDAEYTPQEYKTYFDWGHSVYSEVVRLGLAAGVKKLGLFHLNQDRTDTEMDDMVKACRRLIGKQDHPLDCFAVSCDARFDLS